LYNELIEKRNQITQEAHQQHKDIDLLFEKYGTLHIIWYNCLTGATRVSKAYTVFRTAVTEARKCVIEKKDVAADPYLKQVQYFDALNLLHHAQKNYNVFLMRDFLQLQRSFLAKLTDSVENASNAVGDIRAEDDWLCFQHQKTHNKGYKDILPEVSTKDPGEVLQTRSVIRAGHLEFGGKPYFGVLTEFGFLHYFTSPQVCAPFFLAISRISC
jgi:hypothetical protein